MFASLLLLAAALKPFEFKGVTSGVPIASDMLKRCDEFQEGYCAVKIDGDTVAGAKTLSIYMGSYNQKLTSMSMSTDLIWFDVLTKAFTAKYGPPCLKATPMWSSRVGRPVPNPTYTWCFATGKLKAQLHGVELDVSEYSYEDRNQAPRVIAKPKVDF